MSWKSVPNSVWSLPIGQARSQDFESGEGVGLFGNINFVKKENLDLCLGGDRFSGVVHGPSLKSWQATPLKKHHSEP